MGSPRKELTHFYVNLEGFPSKVLSELSSKEGAEISQAESRWGTGRESSMCRAERLDSMAQLRSYKNFSVGEAQVGQCVHMWKVRIKVER